MRKMETNEYQHLELASRMFEEAKERVKFIEELVRLAKEMR